MTAAVREEHFLPSQRDLDRTAGLAREKCRDQFVCERLRLAAETAPDRRRDDADLRRGHLQHLRCDAMQIVRRLGGCPNRQLLVRAVIRDDGVLLHRRVGVALEKEFVFEDAVGSGEARVHIAELEVHFFVDVVRAARILVQFREVVAQRGVDGHHRRQRFVLDVDQLKGFLGGELVVSDDRGDWVADVADSIDREDVFIGTRRQDAVFHREICAGHDRHDAGHAERTRSVDPFHPRVGEFAAEQLAEKHARQHDIVGVVRRTGHFAVCVRLRQRFSDDGKAFRLIVGPFGRCAEDARNGCIERGSRSIDVRIRRRRNGSLSVHRRRSPSPRQPSQPPR